MSVHGIPACFLSLESAPWSPFHSMGISHQMSFLTLIWSSGNLAKLPTSCLCFLFISLEDPSLPCFPPPLHPSPSQLREKLSDLGLGMRRSAARPGSQRAPTCTRVLRARRHGTTWPHLLPGDGPSVAWWPQRPPVCGRGVLLLQYPAKLLQSLSNSLQPYGL